MRNISVNEITNNIKEMCIEANHFLSKDMKDALQNAFEKLGLSARAYGRILKVARTIADLEQAENITTNHIAEAIQYIRQDKEGQDHTEMMNSKGVYSSKVSLDTEENTNEDSEE